MSNVLKTSIIASFFCLWLTSFISETYQNFFGFFLILTFGLFHGTNDLEIISVILNKNKISYAKISFFYLFTVFIFACSLVFIPFVAMLFFVLISSFHFGQQHWENILSDARKIFKIIFQFSYGFFIFLLLFTIHEKEVIKIIYQITNEILIEKIFLYLLIIFGIILFLLTLYIGVKKSNLRNQIIEQIFYLLVIYIIFKTSNLILGFTVYFVFWHSFPSLYDQVKFVYGSVDLKNIIMYLKTGLLNCILSVVSLAIFYYFFNENEYFKPIVFSFLAAITFPHFLVILKMFQKKSR
jgi:beta-carotene 15,15'-dioxygenase